MDRWGRACATRPSACPRGTMVALWMSSAPGVCTATSAWPDSWYAVRRRASAERTILPAAQGGFWVPGRRIAHNVKTPFLRVAESHSCGAQDALDSLRHPPTWCSRTRSRPACTTSQRPPPPQTHAACTAYAALIRLLRMLLRSPSLPKPCPWPCQHGGRLYSRRSPHP